MGSPSLYTPLTDPGNVARLVRAHGADLRFARALGWRVWDGRAAELYGAYRPWAERTGEDPVPQRVFNLVLTERGLARRRSCQARG